MVRIYLPMHAISLLVGRQLTLIVSQKVVPAPVQPGSVGVARWDCFGQFVKDVGGKIEMVNTVISGVSSVEMSVKNSEKMKMETRHV